MIEPCRRCRNSRFRRAHDGSLICTSCGQVYSEYLEQLGDPEGEIYASGGGGNFSSQKRRLILARVSENREKGISSFPSGIPSLRENEDDILAQYGSDETDYILLAIQNLLIQQIRALIDRRHLPKQFEVNELSLFRMNWYLMIHIEMHVYVCRSMIYEDGFFMMLRFGGISSNFHRRRDPNKMNQDFR